AIAAFKKLKTSLPKVRLLIAPRHPERFGEVSGLLQDSGLRWSRRSNPLAIDDQLSEVILLDSIGELRNLYQLATLVFIGGSIATHGGHNVLEPASLGLCVITGPHTQ